MQDRKSPLLMGVDNRKMKTVNLFYHIRKPLTMTDWDNDNRILEFE